MNRNTTVGLSLIVAFVLGGAVAVLEQGSLVPTDAGSIVRVGTLRSALPAFAPPPPRQPAVPLRPPGLTRETFDSIRSGDSYRSVCERLGSRGRPRSRPVSFEDGGSLHAVVDWPLGGGAVPRRAGAGPGVTIGFKDGRVGWKLEQGLADPEPPRRP